MTQLTADRKANQYGTPDNALPLLIGIPVAASTKLYAGAMVAVDASGNAVTATASTAIKIMGRCEAQVDNSSGAAGDKYVNVKPGVFAMNNSAGVDAITKAATNTYCYVVDDNTVALTDGAGLRPIAGVVFPFDPAQPTLIQVGIGPGFSTVTNPNATSPGGSAQFKARGAVFAANMTLSAFTVATNTDGITYVAGDIVLLTAQTTAKENGPYVVGTVATTAPLTRPDWWAAGSAIQPGQTIQVGGEGTVFGGSEWKALCAKAQVVDTNDPVFYPRVCKGTVTLVSGTKAVGVTQGLFIKSTTASSIMVTRNTFHAGSTTTVTYDAPVASRTAGVAGTAAFSIFGCVAAGTHPGDDASDVDFLVTNW